MSEFEPDEKIYIKKTDHCDTRALKPGDKISRQNVLVDTLAHQQAVALAMDYFARMAQKQANKHDWSKTGSAEHQEEDYLGLFTEALNTGFKDSAFKKLNWWDIHKTKERHHLNDHVPDDVNLVDVLEMVCDCVCAGKARTGNVYPIEIKPEVLSAAVSNTVAILKNRLVVYEDPETELALADAKAHDKSKNYEVYDVEKGKYCHIAYCEERSVAQVIAQTLAKADPKGDAYYLTSGNVLPGDMIPGGGWYDCFKKNEKGEVVMTSLS